jgi:3-phenylpropionate/trans-cinnamate dioxygenase ferredoxin component
MSDTTSKYQFVCKLSELEPNRPQTFEIDNRFVVLVSIAGSVYCVDDVCTHDGGTLGDGELEGNCLVCPRHGAKFDVRTGDAVCMPATEPTASYRVKIEGENVLVQLVD